MILVTGNRRLWAASMAVSLILFAVVYFTVIRPDNNTANSAVKSGLQQSQQVIKQAQKQVSQAGQGGGAATQPAQKALGEAAKLTACLQAAGTDTGKIAVCQTRYGG